MIIRYTSSTFLCGFKRLKVTDTFCGMDPLLSSLYFFLFFIYFFKSWVHFKSQSKMNRYDPVSEQGFIGGRHKPLQKHSTSKHHGTCLKTESGEAVFLDQEVERATQPPDRTARWVVCKLLFPSVSNHWEQLSVSQGSLVFLLFDGVKYHSETNS